MTLSKLQALCNEHKKIGVRGRYNFFFWVNPVKKEAFDFRDKSPYYVNEYLDNKGFDLLNKDLS